MNRWTTAAGLAAAVIAVAGGAVAGAAPNDGQPEPTPSTYFLLPTMTEATPDLGEYEMIIAATKGLTAPSTSTTGPTSPAESTESAPPSKKPGSKNVAETNQTMPELKPAPPETEPGAAPADHCTEPSDCLPLGTPDVPAEDECPVVRCLTEIPEPTTTTPRAQRPTTTAPVDPPAPTTIPPASPPGDQRVPVTGSSTAIVLTVGGTVVAAGALLTLLAQRRRRVEG